MNSVNLTGTIDSEFKPSIKKEEKNYFFFIFHLSDLAGQWTGFLVWFLIGSLILLLILSEYLYRYLGEYIHIIIKIN